MTERGPSSSTPRIRPVISSASSSSSSPSSGSSPLHSNSASPPHTRTIRGGTSGSPHVHNLRSPPAASVPSNAVPSSSTPRPVLPPLPLPPTTRTRASPTGNCDDSIDIMIEWMTKLYLYIGTSTRIEPTSLFVEATTNAYKTLESHLVNRPGKKYEHKTIPREAMLLYWKSAPAHHRQLAETVRMSLLETTWMVYIYGKAAKDPSYIDERLLFEKGIQNTADVMIERLRRICREFPISTKGVRLKAYVRLEKQYFTFMYKVISQGIAKAMRKAPEKKVVLDMSAEAFEDIKNKTKDKLVDNDTNREVVRSFVNTNTSIAFRDWIPMCMRTFMSIDHTLQILEWNKIVPTLNPKSVEHVWLGDVTIRMHEWFRIKSTIPATDEYKAVLFNIAYSSICPLGAFDYHSRDSLSVPSSAEDLARLEYGDETESKEKTITEIQAECKRKSSDIYAITAKDKWTSHIVLNAWYLAQYAWAFDQRIQRMSKDGSKGYMRWLDDYVVFNCNLMEENQKIWDPRRYGSERSPIIVQIGYRWYINTHSSFMECKDIFHVLCVWTYLMLYMNAHTLDSGHDLRNRWSKDFMPKAGPAVVEPYNFWR
jgi:hypothetical protein